MARLTTFVVFSLVMAHTTSQGLQRQAGIAGVVAPDASVTLVQEGFAFTEGPVGRPDGGIYFTDSRPSRVYGLDTTGKIAIFRENADNADGLALNSEAICSPRSAPAIPASWQSTPVDLALTSESSAGQPFNA